jgi:hypothetical protein
MDLIKNTKNAIEIEQKPSKINKAERYPSARNGLVAGSKPTEWKMKINSSSGPARPRNGVAPLSEKCRGPS